MKSSDKIVIDMHVTLAKDHELISEETRKDAIKYIVDVYEKGDEEIKEYIRNALPELYADCELDHRLLNPTENDQIREGQLRYGHETQRTSAINDFIG